MVSVASINTDLDSV